MTRYRVCGTNRVFGHAPGTKFDAELSDIQEERLVAGGHIERVVDLGGTGALDVISAAVDAEFPEQHEPDVNAGDDQDKE